MKNGIRRLVAVILVTLLVTVNGIKVSKQSVFAYNQGIETFVNSLYSDCLGRTADPSGLNDWCNKLATGQITGKQCAYGFFFSPEFINRVFAPDDLIDVYYHVFLNREADPAGKTYWLGKINTSMDFTVADAILFQGFADSAEFATKCATYGITVGAHVDTGINTSNPYRITSSSVNNNSGLNQPAASVEALDSYWISQGYEIYYIDIGEGYQDENHFYITTDRVKCYAKFADMTDHYNLINAWRTTQAMNGGLPPLSPITDPNDPRFQYCRQRAVEVAYRFSHRRPIHGPRMIENYVYYPDPRETFDNEVGENIYGGSDTTRAFEAFRDSPLHAASMRCLYTGEMVCASCDVYFVNTDGLTVTRTSPYPTPYDPVTNTGRGFGAGTVQLFYGTDDCDWWKHPELGWVEYQQNCFSFPDANGNLIGV